MDDLDRQILKELVNDGRKPFSKIAKKLGVTTQTISNRYKEMKNNRTIKKCTIEVSLKKLGYEGSANLLINAVSKPNNKEIIEELWKIKDVFLVSRTVGDFEIFVVLAYRNAIALKNKINEIKRIPGVKHVNFSMSTTQHERVIYFNKFSVFLLEQ